MIDQEIDRQSGNAEDTKYYMTYVLLGLILFLLIVLVILYVIYRYTDVLKRTNTRRTISIGEPINRSKFYTQQTYETMNRDNP